MAVEDEAAIASMSGVREAPAGMLVPQISSADLAVADARKAGLLDGERSEHMSFRAPKALVEAARQQAGITSTTELGIAALAMLAQPDTASAFLLATRGKLGSDHDLEY
ncbi:MAG: hypothetical protein JO157_03360 [Acetobacteraceae bacterium]|nr:hypothetical protein [Acetobacteraceae bacterium]